MGEKERAKGRERKMREDGDIKREDERWGEGEKGRRWGLRKSREEGAMKKGEGRVRKRMDRGRGKGGMNRQ